MKILRILIALVALGGAVDSWLALKVHLQNPNEAPPCAVTEKWDCGAVNHSRFAVFPPRSFDENPNSQGHIPVATIGIIGYILIAILALSKLDFLAFEAAQIGCFCALILTFLEKFVLEKWCIYCVWSQGIAAALVLLTALNWWLSRGGAKKGLHIRAAGENHVA